MASTRVSSESVNHQLEQTSGSCTNEIVVPPSSSSIANNTQPIGSTSKTKQNSELKTAKQWTYYIETLKRTVDCIYEMCRKQHSVIGCKEALMYLSSSVRDFESLIETINVEVAWEVESRPHAVAWEIRKTMSPPGNVDMVGSGKDAETLISMLNLSPVVVEEVVKNAHEKLSSALPKCSDSCIISNNPAMLNNKQSQQRTKPINIPNQEGVDDGWRVVTTRNKRRKGMNSCEMTLSSNEERAICKTPPVTSARRHINAAASPSSSMNVYERLSSGILRPPNNNNTCNGNANQMSRSMSLSMYSNGHNTNGNNNGMNGTTKLTCPRSAMQLPQTKASMAKMAYSRQLLWQKHQMILEEKLQRKRRRGMLVSRKASASVPTLASINFNSNDNNSNNKQKNAAIPTTNDHRNHTPNSTITTTNNAATDNLQSRKIDCIEEMPTENEEDRENLPMDVNIAGVKQDILSTTRSEPPLTEYVVLPDGIDADEAWKAMTEEEESLVQEEQSLKKEIEEEESVSIDDELERQVAAEAAALEQLELNNANEMEVLNEEQDAATLKKEAEARHRAECVAMNTWQDIVDNWKHEMEQYASVSWSEIVEREITHYRKPGDIAQMHEKLLSPSRKRYPQGVNKTLEERQQRAEELRHMLQEEKARRLKELSNKVEEVRRKRAELCERKREHLEKRMEKAEENRLKNIDQIVKKARDDDIKVMEIQFINSMEADNMRHDVMAKNLGWEHRMNNLAAERAKKNEEKAAKEAAVEERRKIAEIQRTERLREQVEKKNARQLLMKAQRVEHERERVSFAKQKQQQHSERIAEKKAIEAAESEKLMKKIIQKQEDSQRRYEQTLKQVKQRAVELSSPRPFETITTLADFTQLPSEIEYIHYCVGDNVITYCGNDKTNSNDDNNNVNNSNTSVMKKCNLCNVELKNDLNLMAHMLSDVHLSMKSMQITDVNHENLKLDLETCIGEADIKCDDVDDNVQNENDYQKVNSSTVKKKRLRIRQKFIARSKEFDLFIKDREKTELQDKGSGKTSVDRMLRQISRVIGSVYEESVLSEYSNGIIKESFYRNGSSNTSFSDSDMHAFERSVSEMDRLLSSSNDSEQKREEMLRVVCRSGVLDTLIALISCASNGDTLLPNRALCKVLTLLKVIVALDQYIRNRIFCGINMIILLDSFSIKFKLLLSDKSSSSVATTATEETSSTSSQTSRITSETGLNLLEQCSLLSSILSTLFRNIPSSSICNTQNVSNTTNNNNSDISDSSTTMDTFLRNNANRFKMITNMMILNGFGELLSQFIKNCGSKYYLRWTIAVDSNQYLLPFCNIIDLVCAFDETLNTFNISKPATQLSSLDSDEGTRSDKSISFIPRVIRVGVDALICRIYSLISNGSLISNYLLSLSAPQLTNVDSDNAMRSVAPLSNIPSSAVQQPQQFDINAFRLLTFTLANLFCILVKREPAQAKECVNESELSLRLIHIFSYCFSSQTENDFNVINTQSSTLKSNEVLVLNSSNFTRQLIFAVGYFASLGVRSQMLCLFGWQRSLLMQLCMLPLKYFSNVQLLAEFMPTLIAICYQNKSAIDLIHQTLNPHIMADFLKSATKETDEEIPEISRFPRSLWPEAIEFFMNC